MFYYIIFFSILQNMLEEWRKRDRTNLTETLNSQEGAGGTEEDKYVLFHYFFSILQNLLEEWREWDRMNLTETLNFLEGAGGTEEDKCVLLH